jgi:hypothetical protein
MTAPYWKRRACPRCGAPRGKRCTSSPPCGERRGAEEQAMLELPRAESIADVARREAAERRASAYAGGLEAAGEEIIALRAIAKTSREVEDAAEHYWSVCYPDQPSTRRLPDTDPAVVAALERLSAARSANDQALHAWEWKWGRS